MADDFVKVAVTGELPAGALKRVRWRNHGVLLANVDGDFYAVGELCPHEDAPLHLGYLKGCDLHCPLHGSYFDVRTGKVKMDPAVDDLTAYPVRLEGDDILIGAPAGEDA